MAKIKKNSILLNGLSGSLGNLVFRQMPDGSTVVSAKPDYSQRVHSEAQIERQERFKLAQAYARQAKDWPVYIEAARRKKKRAYNLAMSDWLQPPVIHSIVREYDRIRVQASDNVEVTKIEIRVLDEEGKVLEQGPAQRVHGHIWEYVPSAEGTVEASVWGLAGNVTVGAL